jgi:hypothetical protein
MESIERFLSREYGSQWLQPGPGAQVDMALVDKLQPFTLTLQIIFPHSILTFHPLVQGFCINIVHYLNLLKIHYWYLYPDSPIYDITLSPETDLL